MEHEGVVRERHAQAEERQLGVGGAQQPLHALLLHGGFCGRRERPDVISRQVYSGAEGTRHG
jgi:hypothetical protein